MELKEIYARYLEDRATGEEIRFLLGCFNDPARLAEVEEMVDVHLEGYHKFTDITRRKKDIPVFLSRLKDGLLRWIDDKDRL